jgi:hypothetical protein
VEAIARMSEVIVTCVAHNHWYPRGFDRLNASLLEYSPKVAVQGWVNELPPGAPENIQEYSLDRDGSCSPFVAKWDYTAYCAKPFALKHALDSGAEVAILCDAAFYAVRDIRPLIDHILQVGYYLCDNGASVGEWSSDRALKLMNLRRDEAFRMTEASSYCVGLHRRSRKALQFARQWCDAALVRGIFEGPHTAGLSGDKDKRNPGWVSDDPRVKGTRHDQTAASIIAWRLGMRELVARPRFTGYEADATEETVLVNRGL